MQYGLTFVVSECDVFKPYLQCTVRKVYAWSVGNRGLPMEQLRDSDDACGGPSKIVELVRKPIKRVGDHGRVVEYEVYRADSHMTIEEEVGPHSERHDVTYPERKPSGVLCDGEHQRGYHVFAEPVPHVLVEAAHHVALRPNGPDLLTSPESLLGEGHGLRTGLNRLAIPFHHQVAGADEGDKHDRDEAGQCQSGAPVLPEQHRENAHPQNEAAKDLY